MASLRDLGTDTYLMVDSKAANCISAVFLVVKAIVGQTVSDLLSTFKM